MRNQKVPGALRRSCLILAATIVALGVARSSGVLHAQGRAVAPQFEGSWLVTVVPAGGNPPPFPALVTYSAGGGLIVSDSSFPPAVGNIYQGTWARTGARTLVFTFLGFQYDNGVHSGYVRVSETVTLASSGDEYDGVATFQQLDLNFNVVLSEPNTTHAVRIRAR